MKLIEGRLNMLLTPKFGEDLYIEFDMTAVQSIREDQEKQSRIRIANVVNGIKTINEIRVSELGLGPVTWGDVWHPPAGVLPYGTFKPGASVPTDKPKPSVPGVATPNKFPSEEGIGKLLTDGSGPLEVPELTPFQLAKLKLLKTMLEKIG
jgi:hypothetical protein